ncbi:DNA-binding transcriptional regulator [Streptomyces sp. CB03234]|uniref:helix-turn-helix transcriptional regulator n=1 Tax=Streptomyces sp. (strain CB03234) TaxID=1703937 RepID=UPI00093C5AC5|nr:YafY family protein [Streptomyces sp. CB03234]OKJ94658.1 DNA-binding transcriptional regulator [Streptomyces sp. CB03234]
MLETSARLLRLLSLLHSRTELSGAELAERLRVSARTVRYDIGKLRTLGYPVHATPGPLGGYRLGAGAKLPPLLLDEEEAVAVALSLRTAAGGTVAGIAEASARALTKLEQVLPDRLRRRVAALHGYTVVVPPGGPAAPVVPPETLSTVAGACRDHQRLRFDYRTHGGAATVREVEPYRLVSTGRRWYLVAFDLARDDWRTFRLDRIEPRVPLGPRFVPRQAPPDDLVPRGVDAALQQWRAEVTVHAPAPVITARVPAAIRVEPLDEARCVVQAGADSPHQLALHILALDADFEVDGPPELLSELATLSARAAGRRPQR